MLSTEDIKLIKQLHNAQIIIEVIDEFLSSKPNRLQIEGVFRVSANGADIKNFLENISRLSNESNLSGVEKALQSETNVHVLLGAAKKTIINTVQIDLSNLHNSLFRPFILAAQEINSQKDTNDEKADHLVKQAADEFQQIILGLLQSHSANHQRVGEILYRYIHIMSLSLQYRGITKMDESNLARLIGANIFSLISLDSGNLAPQEEWALNQIFVDIMEHYLSTTNPVKSFHEYHQDIQSNTSEVRTNELKLLQKTLEWAKNPTRHLVAMMTQKLELERKIEEQKNEKSQKQQSVNIKAIDKELKHLQAQLTDLEKIRSGLKQEIATEAFEIHELEMLIKQFCALNQRPSISNEDDKTSDPTTRDVGFFRHLPVTIEPDAADVQSLLHQ